MFYRSYNIYLFIKISILIFRSNCFTSRQENQDLNLNNCLVIFLSSSLGDGGAIYINSNLNLIINNCIFYECMSTLGNGGAIFFLNGLDINLKKVCVFLCRTSSTYSYQFSYFQTNNNQILNLTSISKCYNQSLGYEVIRLWKGIQNISNSNISNNNNIHYSAISYLYPIKMFSIFCNFFNNSVYNYLCIYLHDSKGDIFKSNIINNNSPTNYGVITVWNSGHYTLNDCFFDNNFNTLFYVHSGSLTLNNCYFYSGSNYFIGNIINQLITISNNLFQFNNFQCLINSEHSNYYFKKKIYFIIILNIIF